MRRWFPLFLALLALPVACDTVRTTAGPAPSEQVVPWIDTRYAAPSPSPFAPDIDHCSATDLKIEPFGDVGAAAGTSYAHAEVRNVSSSSCVLTSKVIVRYLDEDGEAVQTGPLVTYRDAVIVEPSSSAQAERVQLSLAIPNVCPPARAISLAISLFPGNETMELPPTGSGPSPSPGECSELGSYALSVETTDLGPPSPFAALEAEIRAPETVTPGTTFAYRVLLKNPTQQTVTLDPCPGYTEGFKAPNGGQASYLLNCSDVEVIGPGQTIIYEMELEVPEDFGPETSPQRRALLSWLMLNGGPGASAEVEVL